MRYHEVDGRWEVVSSKDYMIVLPNLLNNLKVDAVKDDIKTILSKIVCLLQYQKQCCDTVSMTKLYKVDASLGY